MNKNIFVACDVSNHNEIIELLSSIHKEISGIKIGLQYIDGIGMLEEQIFPLSQFLKNESY